MASDQEYSDHDAVMMELAADALVEASRTNNLEAAVAIYAATPPKFRTDLRDFAVWIVETQAAASKALRDWDVSATLH